MGRDSVEPTNDAGRRNPPTGVYILRDRSTIVFLTICTLSRKLGLANSMVHNALVEAWKEADAWLVGAYVIMPDHIHLSCAPQGEEVSICLGSDLQKDSTTRQSLAAPAEIGRSHKSLPNYFFATR